MESNIIKVVNEENRKIANVEATHIEWERIFLNIDVTVEYNVKEEEGKPLDFYAVNGLNSAKAIYEKVEIGKNQYRLRINITNTGENRCVPFKNSSRCLTKFIDNHYSVRILIDLIIHICVLLHKISRNICCASVRF